MAGWSNTYASKVGNHFLRNSSQTPDTSLYLAALTTLGADDGTGFVEVTAGDYGRQGGAIAAGGGGGIFGAAANRLVANTGLVTFTGGAGSAWGTVVGLAICNHLTNSIATSMVAFGALDTSINVPVGGQLSFAAGKVTFAAPSFFTIVYGNKILEHFLRNNAQAPDAVVGLALYQSQPDPDLGTGGTECPASWYVRKSLGLGAFSNGVGSNGGDLLYVSNALADGGTLLYGALTTNLTTGGGAVIGSGALSAGIVAAGGSTVDFPPGSVSLKID
jgi:hypothetical protein